ncbi:MAG TPA: hypothetical protein P5107_08000 [Thermotogota bacterium]|nr:hypothetical protein [Thermotogota bacterium]HRW34983.1 hypothetical protein [Thermotogota bacterium]
MTISFLEKIREIERKMGKDWLQQFEGLTTKEEIIKAANQNGIELSDNLAQEGLNLLQANENDELGEEELSAVAGGKIVFH